MAALLADGGNAQRIELVPPCQRLDRARHCSGEQQRAAGLRRRIEQRFELLAKAHVQHLVGLVENGDGKLGKVERATLEVIAQAAGCPDDDGCAAAQHLAFGAGIHPAHTCRDAGAGLGVEPGEFAADLQGEFTRRRNDERARLDRELNLAVFADELVRHGKAEGDGLARTGLRGNDEIPPPRLLFQHSGLDIGGSIVSLFGKGDLEGFGKRGERHENHSLGRRGRTLREQEGNRQVWRCWRAGRSVLARCPSHIAPACRLGLQKVKSRRCGRICLP